MGKLTVMKLQENPDGREGHNERERLQIESKQGPSKKRYCGNDKHYYTKPPTANLKKRQEYAFQILDMKELCDDYKESCKPFMCALCPKREARCMEIVMRAKALIEKYENELKERV